MNVKENKKLNGIVRGCMPVLAILSASSAFADNNQDAQAMLSSLAGNWHSVGGYIVNNNGSSCYTTQPFAFYYNGTDLASFSYSMSCSNGYQGQMQGLDFNPRLGTYRNGYNSISSQYIYNNNVVAGIERKMVTTWGFGSMVNYQYQTVRIMAPTVNANGTPETLSFELSNSQSNNQNGQVTTYHLDLVK